MQTKLTSNTRYYKKHEIQLKTLKVKKLWETQTINHLLLILFNKSLNLSSENARSTDKTGIVRASDELCKQCVNWLADN